MCITILQWLFIVGWCQHMTHLSVGLMWFSCPIRVAFFLFVCITSYFFNMLNILDILGDFWFYLSLPSYSTLFGPWIISVICSSSGSLGLFSEPFQCYSGQLHSPGDSEALGTLPVQPGCWFQWVWEYTSPGWLSVTGWRTRNSRASSSRWSPCHPGVGAGSPLDSSDAGPGGLGSSGSQAGLR